MRKKIITSCFLFLTFYLLGCAPKVAPPPLYRGMDLSLEEVIAAVRKDVDTLKAVVSISAKKAGEPYSHVDASLLLRKPDWIHVKFYSFGLPVGSFLMKDNTVQAVTGRGGGEFKGFGRGLYYSVFWWDDIEDALMYRQASNYVIRTENREIRLDKSTLLPESQEITVNDKKIYVLYEEPRKVLVSALQGQSLADFWFPSVLRIEAGAFILDVKIEKLLVNPQLSEGDFKEL